MKIMLIGSRVERRIIDECYMWLSNLRLLHVLLQVPQKAAALNLPTFDTGS